jgi:AmmeMemoRadiSam system protein B
VAGAFYPAEPDACRAAVETALAQASAKTSVSGRPLGGIVPHAGFSFSGATAATVFDALSRRHDLDTVIVFGAVHRFGTDRAALYPGETWETPLGPALVDRELAKTLAAEAGDLVTWSEDSHRAEHSIEVQVPFLRHLFPKASLLPVNVMPVPEAIDLGRATAAAVKSLDRKAAVLGSTDLTHYGPRFGYAPRGAGAEAHAWMKEHNDRPFLDRLLALDGPGALRAASENHSACGAGAAAAALACAVDLGAKSATLLAHTTSQEVLPDRTPCDFVGYGAVLFSEP